MTISRLNIDGSTLPTQDFLDLIMAMRDLRNNNIKVIYRDGYSLSRKHTEYSRDNQGNWWMLQDKGTPANQRVRVNKEDGQYSIQYI
jgi:hypothetical protein